MKSTPRNLIDACMCKRTPFVGMLSVLFMGAATTGFPGSAAFAAPSPEKKVRAAMVFARVEGHAFHPLNQEQTFTHDRNLALPGIADLDDTDWRVRLLAVRDLVRLGIEEAEAITEGLSHPNPHVRQTCAMALGILRAESTRKHLETLARKDPIAMVRSQAVTALGQMEATASLPAITGTFAGGRIKRRPASMLFGYRPDRKANGIHSGPVNCFPGTE